MSDPMTWVPSTLVALMAMGMALAFISADPTSPTSRALAIALVFLGISFGLSVPLLANEDQFPDFARWLVISDALCMAALLEWILRVRQTVPAGDHDVRAGDYALRFGQAAAVFYAGAGILYPRERAAGFLGAAEDWQVLASGTFWLFATPIIVAMLAGALSSLLLLRRNPDKPERVRIVALMVATPFLAIGLVLPLEWGTISMVLGELIFLIGAIHYHVMQGERGQFMARFMSPQVASLVRARGFKQAMQDRTLELTVVCVDLRGFTAYAQAHPSRRVIRVLRDYYRAGGKVVAEFGGTIKDLAGDGMLILVGAPLPAADHAARAVAMARRIREAVQPLVRSLSQAGPTLGVGLGVATGRVTVGGIGAGDQYEYTAVGPAVNLASRLCELAADGEILVSADTIALCPERGDLDGLRERPAAEVKGYAEPVRYFNVGLKKAA